MSRNPSAILPCEIVTSNPLQPLATHHDAGRRRRSQTRKAVSARSIAAKKSLCSHWPQAKIARPAALHISYD